MNMDRVTHLTSPNVSYFSLPSLYASLQDEEIAVLEKAFALVVTGAYSEAEIAYERLPLRLKFHPVVVIGRSTGLTQQWRFREAHQILQEAIDQEFDAGSREENILIRAVFAYVTIAFKGSFVQARDSIRELRQLITTIQVEDFTDVQVFVCDVIGREL